jgi:hypothetical protein
MGYVKPGVSITQVQKSSTPILVTPDLEAVIIGDGFWIQDITWDNLGDPLRNSVASATFTTEASLTGSLGDLTQGNTKMLVASGVNATQIALSGINPLYYDVTTHNNADLVHVDLVGISGYYTGVTRHLVNGVDFTVSDNTINIKARAEYAEDGITVKQTKYIVKVGFRAVRSTTSVNTFKKLETANDVENQIGEAVTYNPLAFGAFLAMKNSGASVNVIQLEYSASNPSAKVTSALDDILSTKDVYAIAPVTHNVDIVGLKTHCETYSSAINKKERIAIVNKEVAYNGDANVLTAASKDTIAANIRDGNSIYQSRRVYSIHPDCGYVIENRPLVTVKPSWIQKSFDYFSTKNFGDDSNKFGLAKLATDATINGVVYKSGSFITEALWTLLYNSNYGGSGLVTVLVPVPGYFFSAAVAGQVIGKNPEQPLTNVPIAGFNSVYGSQDIFSEADLNKMAEGGTYILTQDAVDTVYSRHQMSTDITSVAKRELSVTTALDYTAKFIRKSLKPYIGNTNITPDFLKLVNTILVGTGLTLVRQGVVNDIKVGTVSVDDLNPDTILAEVNVLVKYPVNYIKITLVF